MWGFTPSPSCGLAPHSVRLSALRRPWRRAALPWSSSSWPQPQHTVPAWLGRGLRCPSWSTQPKPTGRWACSSSGTSPSSSVLLPYMLLFVGVEKRGAIRFVYLCVEPLTPAPSGAYSWFFIQNLPLTTVITGKSCSSNQRISCWWEGSGRHRLRPMPFSRSFISFRSSERSDSYTRRSPTILPPSHFIFPLPLTSS